MAQVAIGAAAIFARYSLTGAGPIVTAALRLAIGALPMIALALISNARRYAWQREAGLATAGLMLAFHFGTWIASLQYTSVAVSTLLVTTTPLFTETYDSIRLKRPPSVRIITALVIAAAGLSLIALQQNAPAPIAGRAQLGVALALLGAISMAAYFVLVRAASLDPVNGERMPTRAIVSRTFTWGAMVLAVAAVAAQQAPPPLRDRTAWFGILGMGLVSQLLGHTGLNAALKHFSPTIVSSTTLLEPVVAAVLAAILFGETLHSAVVAGGVLILTAVGLALTEKPEYSSDGL